LVVVAEVVVVKTETPQDMALAAGVELGKYVPEPLQYRVLVEQLIL